MQILNPDEVIFDRFQVGALVNGAGQSFGYRAVDLCAPEHKPWLRDIYLKQFHDLVPGTEEAASISRHFAALQTRLGEKAGYICLPLALGEAGNSIVAAYPWIEGMTLRNRLESGLNHDECVRLAIAVTKSVKWMHYKGVAHLDLKPENVVVQEGRKDGKLYVRMIDLDAARIDDVGLRDRVIGTIGYMSPEHLWPGAYGSVSVRSDIFTLGIMLFEILFHCHPFLGDHRVEYRDLIGRGEVIVPENTYHREVVSRVLACLLRNPSRRPPASLILSTLNFHFGTGLLAERDEDLWFQRRRRVFVQLEDSASGFRRTYFETVEIGRNEFRGIPCAAGMGFNLKLTFDDYGCSLSVLNSGTGIEIEGRMLEKGDKVRLVSEHNLILGGVELSIKAIDY